MKPNRVPEDLLQAGFDAIRAWYAAHPGSNSYLDDRTQMRLVLAAALTVHNQRVEQPLRDRAEAAERELVELQERIGKEGVEWCVRFETSYGPEVRKKPSEYYARKTLEWARAFDANAVLKQRVVGTWKVVEQRSEGSPEVTPWTDHGDGWKSRRPTLSDFQGPFTGLLGPFGTSDAGEPS